MRLFLVEVLSLLAAFVALVLYFYFDIPLRMPVYLLGKKFIAGCLVYATGLLVTIFFVRFNEITAFRKGSKATPVAYPRYVDTFSNFKARYLDPSLLFRDVRVIAAISLCIAAFMHLKHLIPHVNSTLHDPAIAAFENSFFAGIPLSSILIEKLGTQSAFFFSSVYTAFYPYMALLTVAVLLSPEGRRAGSSFVARYAVGFSLLWYLGILIEYAVPTWGPCFSSPELFSSLPETEVSLLQAQLWENKLYTAANPQSIYGMFLISGVPSLHIAVLVFGTAICLKLHRSLAFLSLLLLLFTFVATIYFGWHFLIDDIAGVLLALVCLGLTSRYAR